MSLSQFTIYRSTDASAPSLFGASGSLLTVLNACLVNGYGSKAAAGWTLPLGTSGTDIVAYKQGAGAGMCLMVNDAASEAALGREALACGYAAVSSEGPSGMGTGTGQFPTPAQLLTVGAVVIRKSNTADSTNARAWAILADASTFYLFIQSGDISGAYMAFMFGDFFSLAGSADPYRCAIIGRGTENQSNADTATGGFDQVGTVESSPLSGFFWANSLSGASGSQKFVLVGDMSKTAYVGTVLSLQGVIPSPNTYDSSYYICPLYLSDSSFGLRGMLRGCYMLCHATTNFSDGQTFSGANDYAGKSFLVFVKGSSGGMFCMETSNTVGTN